MELYHKITKEVLELLLKEGAQMPVDLGRKLQRSSSNMQQVREYLSGIGCIHVTKQRNFYELKITEKGTILLEVMRQLEKLDKTSKTPFNMPKITPSKPDIKDFENPGVTIETLQKAHTPKPKPEVIPDEVLKEAIDKEIKASEPPKVQGLKPEEEIIKRGGRIGILKRF